MYICKIGLISHIHLIGGAPDQTNFTGDRYTHGFEGCVHVLLGLHQDPVVLKNDAISGVNVDACPK